MTPNFIILFAAAIIPLALSTVCARYFWVNFAFWLLSMGLMGGIIGMCGAMPV